MLNIKFMFCTFWDPDLIRVHQDNVTSVIWFMGCIEKKKVMSTSIEQFMTNTARNKKLEYLYLCSFYFNLSLVSPVTFWNCNTTSPESPFNSQYLLNNSAGVIFGPALSIHWPLEFFCFLTKKKKVKSWKSSVTGVNTQLLLNQDLDVLLSSVPHRRALSCRANLLLSQSPRTIRTRGQQSQCSLVWVTLLFDGQALVVITEDKVEFRSSRGSFTDDRTFF